jgi:hypothetical protein
LTSGARILFLKARDGQLGLTVGDRVYQLFVYPARVRSSGEFTQAVIHVTDVRGAAEEMKGRGVEFEEYNCRQSHRCLSPVADSNVDPSPLAYR